MHELYKNFHHKVPQHIFTDPLIVKLCTVLLYIYNVMHGCPNEKAAHARTIISFGREPVWLAMHLPGRRLPDVAICPKAHDRVTTHDRDHAVQWLRP
jgi:hypothetical protein